VKKIKPVRPICKDCANKLGLTVGTINGKVIGDFGLGEPCADCGECKPVQFTDFLLKNGQEY